MHGGDMLAIELEAQSVTHLFTLCGGHISPILAGAKKRGVRIVDVRDEATAVFAADAVARLTGIPGVAAVTAGPGLTNTITAIKNAQLAQSPVVIIGGAAPTILKGKGSLQDIDQKALIRPHVKYLKCVKRVQELVPVMREAFIAAKRGVPGPVFVECPVDLLYDESVIRGWYQQATPSGNSLTARAVRRYLEFHLRRQFAQGTKGQDKQAAPTKPTGASRRQLERVATALGKAKKPMLLIGSQAMLQERPVSELVQAIEALGLPVYLSGMARGLLGKAHPLHMRHKRRLALRESDCVILAGVPCDFRLDYGNHIPRRAVYVSANRSSHDLTLNRRPTIGIESDAGSFLCELGAAMQESKNAADDWVNSLRNRDDEREQEIDIYAGAETDFVNPFVCLKR